MVLTERGLSEAIQEYIEKDEKYAIVELINHQITKTQKLVKETNCLNDVQLNDEIKRLQQVKLSNQDEEDTEIKSILEKTRKECQETKKFTNFNYDSDEEQNNFKSNNNLDDEEDEEVVETVSKRGAGRGTRGGAKSSGPGSRGGRGRGSRGGSKRASNTTSKSSQVFTLTNTFETKKPCTNKPYLDIDSDDEIIKIDEHLNSKSKQQSTIRANMPKSSQGIRRTRIDYDDDEEIIMCPTSSKKSKSTTNNNNNSDEECEQITNTYSIFKKVANTNKKNILK